MKMRIEVEGCPFEDAGTINVYAHALDFAIAVSDAKNMVCQKMRGKREWKSEESFLEDLLETLNVGVEIE